MHTFMRRTSKFLENVSLLFLLLLFACVLIQIIMRNFFDSGSVKLEELARVCLVSLVFLMVPVLIVDKQHIIVDLLINYLPKRVRRIFEIVIQSLSFGLTMFLLFSIRQVMLRNWSVCTPALRMPNIILYIPIVLGLLFMAVGTIVYLLDAIQNREVSS